MCRQIVPLYAFIVSSFPHGPPSPYRAAHFREVVCEPFLKTYPFEIQSGWHSAKVEIVSFSPEEIFGTKLRALLQRHKNRDLFDLNQGLLQLGLDRDGVIACFRHYLALENHPITRANAEERMLGKLSQSLTDDIVPLLPAHVTFSTEDAISAFGRVWRELIGRIPGDSWKLSQTVIDEIRRGPIPNLLTDDEHEGAP